MIEHLVRVHVTVDTMAAGASVGDAAEKTIRELQDILELNNYKIIRIWDGSKKEVEHGKTCYDGRADAGP